MLSGPLYFEPFLHKRCLAALIRGAGVEQPFDCLIVENRQAVQFLCKRHNVCGSILQHND